MHLDLRDRRLRVLFEIAASQCALATVDDPDLAGRIVTDAVPVDGPGRPLILVLAEATPLACRTAVDLVEQGLVVAVLTPDRASLLGEVVALAGAGQASLPAEVITAAADAPQITPRQRQVLRLVASGWSNAQAAGRLHVSATTVKRDVSDLLRAFGCRSRMQLRVAARDLGLHV